VAIEKRKGIELILSPSEQFNKYLAKSGFKTFPHLCKGRTKWHFCYQERDGFIHYGFVEKKDHPLTGAIDIDKRYRPFQGYPMQDGSHNILYCHVVLDKDMRRAAIMTPWSFLNLDPEIPDYWCEDNMAMMFRVPESSYRVVDLNTFAACQLITMEEIDE
jgi:hypothetical protein